MKRIMIIMMMKVSVILISCAEGTAPGGDDVLNNGPEVVISENGDDGSHKNGAMCMSCHTRGGTAEGWFTLAGSIYLPSGEPAENGWIELYTGKNGSGTKINSTEVDAKGNFYTTRKIDYTAGLYAVIISADGKPTFKNSAVTHGNCNSCHGITAPKIKF
ncbi:MAG: hypothetical protein ACOCZW_02885 [Bacteroidota bacterium]